MTYKVALFDKDDTLLASSAACWAQHKHIAKRYYDVEITDEILHLHWGKPFLELIAEVYGPVAPPQLIAKQIGDTDGEYFKGPLDGAVAAVNHLLHCGLEVGIITSAPTHVAKSDLALAGFPVDRLLCIVGEEGSSICKPDPKVFEAVFSLLDGLLPSEVVYIGDLLVDLQAAQAAGIDFIGVRTGVIAADALQQAGATTVVDDATAAAELILSVN